MFSPRITRARAKKARTQAHIPNPTTDTHTQLLVEQHREHWTANTGLTYDSDRDEGAQELNHKKPAVHSPSCGSVGSRSKAKENIKVIKNSKAPISRAGMAEGGCTDTEPSHVYGHGHVVKHGHAIAKPPVKELILTEEETRMKGAPEGSVYEVNVMSSEELQPSVEPVQELQLVLQAGPSIGWAEQHTAIDSIRRLALHHTDLILAHLPHAVDLVLEAVTSLRSSIIRNAVLCMEDLYSRIALKLGQHSTRLVAAVLGKCGSEKKFICTSAQQTLTTAIAHGPPLETLMGALASVSARNLDISACSVKCIDGLLRRLSAEGTLIQYISLTNSYLPLGVSSEEGVGVKEDVSVFACVLRALERGLNGRSPSGKSSARSALRRLREGLTHEVFDGAVVSILPEIAAADVIRESSKTPMQPSSSVRPDIGSSRGARNVIAGKMSNAESKGIKHRIMAADTRTHADTTVSAQPRTQASSLGEVLVIEW